MKSLITLLLLLFAGGATYAQKGELDVYAGTGLYNYTGNATNTYSWVQTNQYSDPMTGNINNPYGRISTFSYEAGLQAQWVTKSRILFGSRLGYEVLRSQTTLNRLYFTGLTAAISPTYNSIYIYTGSPAKGTGILNNQYVNINPYIGYRFKLGKISLDAMPGVNFGIATYSKENGSVKVAGNNNTSNDYKIDQKLDNPKNDTRVNMNLAFNWQRWGITAAYSHGLTNYDRGLVSANPNSSGTYAPKVYSQLISAGLYYKLQ